MTGMQSQEPESHPHGVEFHLADLVPADCCREERVDHEIKLQLLEQSLKHWLQDKITEIDSRRADKTTPTQATIDSSVRCAGLPRPREEVTMVKDDRDILDVLQTELDFIEKGGYGRSVRTPGKAKSPLQDSLTCINYPFQEKQHACSECHLIDFVPDDRRSEEIPCHFIPLNESGVTLEELGATDNQHKLEEALKDWLRVKISEVEAGQHRPR